MNPMGAMEGALMAPYEATPPRPRRNLAALNQGLTEALRIADRRLVQLNDDGARKNGWHGSTTAVP